MHMADALLAPAVAATMYVASGTATGISIHKLKKDDEPGKLPTMAVTAALVFAGQMINYTIPGTGSSGHMCGGMLLSALLGPQAGFLSMAVILTIQCLLFGDGGLMALGANIWNMAFYGCFVGSLLIWRPIMKKGATRLKIILASIIGCVLTLQMGAFSVTIETMLSGVTELPFKTCVAAMQPIHLAIGLVEGLITAAVVLFVYEARPELLWGVGEETKKEAKLSFGWTLGILGGLALLIGGALSLVASSLPDGLEWAIGRITGSEELEAAEAGIYAAADKVQSTTSFLPDYAFKGSESAAGTTVSGIVGALIVVVVMVGSALLFRYFKGRKKEEAPKAGA